jgi:hypothetical protein
MKTRIAIALLVLALASFAQAQSLSNNTTNFPMIGVVPGQTLQINVQAYPPVPCDAVLGFQNSAGDPVGTTLTVTLQAGQSAALTINADTLTTVPGQRVEVLPTVVVDTVSSANQCDASAEVYDNLLGITSVLVPGTEGWPPEPVFGLLGVTEFQTVRLNVVALPPNPAFPPVPCIGTISFVNSSGATIGTPLNVQLASGQATFLDLPGNTLVTKLGQRAEVEPVVTAPNGGCVASTEVYLNGIGATTVYWP